MVDTRQLFTRLDRFIQRKQQELGQLLDLKRQGNGCTQGKLIAKVAHLRNVLAKAKKELGQLENTLTRPELVKTRLKQAETEYQRCRQHLETQVANAPLYREIRTEAQRLSQRIQILKAKLGNDIAAQPAKDKSASPVKD